ncbi:MAG: tRNA (adenosine(37)-N6)-dimethylallyltransferase MiaA [Actinomycetota bacterium]|nr:tRNA (adenosine(37)-N6)-dimethylallyltransferase MiaA [Actinomycetota bacterium]
MSIIAVLGPTAAGKSEVAEAIAERIRAEIVSVDSMQVFRGMDIGTAKPNPDTRRRFAYHLVDVADPSDEYTVAEFQAAGAEVLDRIESSGGTVVIAGGSGLHFRSLVDPLEFPPTDADLRTQLEASSADELRGELTAADSAAGEVIDMANPRRVLRAVEIMRLTGATPTSRAESDEAQAVRAYQSLRVFTAIGVDPGAAIRQRIEERLDAMLDDGLVDEVAALASTLGRTARHAVGYRELLAVIEGDRDLATARDDAIAATASLVKRQRTYFRRDPRIGWIPWHHDPEQVLRSALAQIQKDMPWIS